jgi:hypothetical protein
MNRKSLFLLSLLLSSFFQPLGASCDPPGSAMAASKVTIAAITTKIGIMSAALIQTLKLHTAQLTSNIQALPVAFAKISTAQTQSLSQIAQEGEEARIIRDFTPSLAGCQNGTLGRQLGEGERLKEKHHAALNRQAYQRILSFSPSDERVKARYDHRQEKYCGSEDLGAGLCKKKSTLADADVLPGETLLNKKTLETKEERQAAFDLTAALLNPVPSEPLEASQVQNKAEQEAFLDRKSQEARQNLAQNIFSEMISDREPVLDGKWMGEILLAQDSSEKLKLPAKISRREFMELEINRRYENPRWYVDVQQMEPAELQCQLLHMTALLLKMMADQNRSLEHLTSLQATQLSMQQEQMPASLPSQTLLTGGKK